jgi:ABC-type glutathione transport system ATPase component
MLEVRNLAKRYDGANPVDAVCGASLELEPRRFLAVVGR